MIRDINPKWDAAGIAAIYNYYILETTITFEMDPLTPEDMLERIHGYIGDYPWLVAEEQGRIVGYAYATKFRDRPAYCHTCEVSVYCDHEYTGRGLGPSLLKELLTKLYALPQYYTAIAVIVGGNQRSTDLFSRQGFTHVGTIKNAGRKMGQWLDTYDYVLPLKDYDSITAAKAGE